MQFTRITFASAALIALIGPALADLQVIQIDPNSLPFALGPAKFDNSPDKFDNSADKFDNSDEKFSNSEGMSANSPNMTANSANGKRRLISEDGEFIGYYVYSEHGVLNFFNVSGKRIAFTPSGGHTQSLFSGNEWCGTIANSGGKTVLGMSPKCFFRFKFDN